MPPKKLPTKTKKRKSSGASTSGTQQTELLSTKEYARERRKRFQRMKFINHQYLDWDLLDQYGMIDILPQVVKDDTWFKLFAIREPTYKEVTMEFLSTMYIETDDRVTKMKFQAYGELREVGLKEVGQILGLYESSDVNWYLPNGWTTESQAAAFWLELIKPRTDPFIPSKSLSTTFAAVEHKLLHHLISHTISCKKTSHSKVTSFDLLYLHSMISDRKIDIGVEVANFMDRQITDTRTKVISCGGYITALLKGMGIFQQPEGDQGIECKKISNAPFRLWGLNKPSLASDDDDDDRVDTESAVPEITPYMGPSTSSAPPPPPPSSGSRYDQLKQEIVQLKKENKRERKKNKKFRKSLVNMLKAAFSCINQSAADQLQYETSDEEASTEGEES